MNNSSHENGWSACAVRGYIRARLDRARAIGADHEVTFDDEATSAEYPSLDAIRVELRQMARTENIAVDEARGWIKARWKK